MNKNIHISDIQVRGLIVSTVIGVGILFLPNTLGKISGKDGWIPIILTGLILLLFIIMINKIFEINPGKDFFEIGRESMGNIIFTIFLIFLAIHFVISVSFITRQLAELVKAFLLPSTPATVIVAVILLPTIYISLYEIDVIARMSYIIYPLILVTIILLIITAIPTADFENILPQFQSDISKIPKGMLEALFSFSGFEILLFALPYVKDKKKALKSSLIGIGIITIIYTSLFILTLTQFSINQIRRMNFPIIMVTKLIDLPGFFIQNLDNIFMSFWIIVAFGTTGPTYYALGKTVNKIFKNWRRKYIVVGFGPLVYIISMLPRDILVLYNVMGKILNISTIISIVIIPLIIFLVVAIKGRVKE